MSYHIVMVKQRLKMNLFESVCDFDLHSHEWRRRKKRRRTRRRKRRQRNVFRKQLLYGNPKLQDHLADAFEDAQECSHWPHEPGPFRVSSGHLVFLGKKQVQILTLRSFFSVLQCVLYVWLLKMATVVIKYSVKMPLCLLSRSHFPRNIFFNHAKRERGRKWRKCFQNSHDKHSEYRWAWWTNKSRREVATRDSEATWAV